MSSMCHGSKLEHWQHPEVEGSIQPNALRSASRNPKLFFGTTTTTTSTSSGVTYCFSNPASVTTSCRKKRHIDDSPIEDYLSFDPSLIKPAKSREPREANRGVKGGPRNDQSRNFSKLEELNQLANVRMAGKEAKEERIEPRFFLFYWYTSTVTSTTTTYTTTKTFTISLCYPSTSFSYAICG